MRFQNSPDARGSWWSSLKFIKDSNYRGLENNQGTIVSIFITTEVHILVNMRILYIRLTGSIPVPPTRFESQLYL